MNPLGKFISGGKSQHARLPRCSVYAAETA